MALTGLKKVDAGRTTGIGRWVQELGTCDFTVLKSFSYIIQLGETFIRMY